MTKKNEDPNHHMGTRTGYTLIDGEYHIAPMYQEQFDELVIKSLAIGELLKIVNRHAENDLEQILKVKRRLWADIYEDIGLDKKEGWIYKDGVIKRKEEKDSKSLESTTP